MDLRKTVRNVRDCVRNAGTEQTTHRPSDPPRLRKEETPERAG